MERKCKLSYVNLNLISKFSIPDHIFLFQTYKEYNLTLYSLICSSDFWSWRLLPVTFIFLHNLLRPLFYFAYPHHCAHHLVRLSLFVHSRFWKRERKVCRDFSRLINWKLTSDWKFHTRLELLIWHQMTLGFHT